jgi:tripartite-type tricarboxylate transporter receptor subunit TctC
MRQLAAITTISAVALAARAGSEPAAAKEYYAGKNITVLVGFSAGGGTDTAARIMTKHFGKYIPGKPGVQVKNMPGAGSIRAHNFTYEKAKPDGFTIMYTPVQFSAQLFEAKGVRFEYGKFSLVGALKGSPFVMFARTDSVPGGLKKPADFINATDVRFAGIRPTVTLDMLGRTSLDLLGMKFTYIPGYRGAAKIRPAIRSGEANAAVHGLVGWRSGVEPTMGKAGIVKALWYYPLKNDRGHFVKSPLIPEMKSFLEIYKEIKGTEPSGPFWDALKLVLDLRGIMTNLFVGPPGMNKEALAALRVGFREMVKDGANIAQQKKSIGFACKEVPQNTATKFIANLDQTDPKLIEFWKNYIRKATKKKKK